MPRKPTLSPEDRKQRKNQYMKEYYERRKVEIKEVRCQKMKCDICFGKYTPSHKAQHMTTLRHVYATQCHSQAQTPENESVLKT